MAPGRRLASRAALATVLLFAWPSVFAGTDAVPEVADPENDVVYNGADASLKATSREEELDVSRAFFEDWNATHFRVVLVLARLSEEHDRPLCECAWAVTWAVGSARSGAAFYRQAATGNAINAVAVTELARFEDRFYLVERASAGDASPFANRTPTTGTVTYGRNARIVIDVPLARAVEVPLADGSTPGSGEFTLLKPMAEAIYPGRQPLTMERADRAPDCSSAEEGVAPIQESQCGEFGRSGVVFAVKPQTSAGGPIPLRPASNETSAENETAQPLSTETLGSAEPSAAPTSSEPLEGAAPERQRGLLAAAGGGSLVLLVAAVLVARRTRLERKLRRAARRAGMPPALDIVDAQARAARDAGELTVRAFTRVAVEVAEARRALTRGISTRYRHVRDLPAGSFARTWVAEDTAVGRLVVVKELHEHLLADDRVRAAFLREAHLAGQLNHPNVVTVHDVETTPGSARIVMEFVEGGSLDERLRRGMLPPALALRIVDEILRGLAAVHAVGVVHRDLKPANILLTTEGHAKIADFGVAHAPSVETAARLSVDGQPGTPLYMAPEQVTGTPPDARTDLYAIGAILAEALGGLHYLGSRSFPSRHALERAILEDPPRLFGVAARPPFDALLRRALAKRPNDRFSNATEMRRALEAAARAGGYVGVVNGTAVA